MPSENETKHSYFCKTKINIGAAALETIPFELTESGASRPLLMAGPEERSLLKKVRQGFAESAINIAGVFLLQAAPHRASANSSAPINSAIIEPGLEQGQDTSRASDRAGESGESGPDADIFNSINDICELFVSLKADALIVLGEGQTVALAKMVILSLVESLKASSTQPPPCGPAPASGHDPAFATDTASAPASDPASGHDPASATDTASAFASLSGTDNDKMPLRLVPWILICTEKYKAGDAAGNPDFNPAVSSNNNLTACDSNEACAVNEFEKRFHCPPALAPDLAVIDPRIIKRDKMSRVHNLLRHDIFIAHGHFSLDNGDGPSLGSHIKQPAGSQADMPGYYMPNYYMPNYYMPNYYMPGYYEYCCRTRVWAGRQELEKIPEIAAFLGAKRPMLLTDAGVTGAGLPDLLQTALQGRVKIAVLEDEVPPDSDITVVNQIARKYQSFECDSIIALGGGSVLDTAKGVNIVVSTGVDDLRELAGAGIIRGPLKPFIAIPTTSGTGSEVTLAAVIADHAGHQKIPFTSNYLQPDAAILDSRLTLSLPGPLTAATAMDALTHAMEAYTCLAKNPVSDAQAWKAVKLISDNLVRVLKNPQDHEGRLALAAASCLAGMAFSNSMVGIVHALGHSVGAVCNVPHGNCMAILLPYGLEYNLAGDNQHAKLYKDSLGELLLPLAGEAVYRQVAPQKRGAELIKRLHEFNTELHEVTSGRYPCYLGEIKNQAGEALVPQKLLPAIADTVMSDAAVLFNPREVDRLDALKVLEAAWIGKNLL